MHHRRLIQTGMLAAVLAITAGGCRRQTATPELQTTAGVQTRATPMTVAGCLKSGVSDDTFVLIASKDEGALETATYQLNGKDGDYFRQYVNQRVEVDGTLRAEQEVASTGGATEAKPAKGTSGTPTVSTKTEIDVKQMTVNAVRPTGNKCD